MQRTLSKETNRLLIALGFSSAVSISLFLARLISSGSWRYSFLLWNLVLAWVPLAIAWWLFKRLSTAPWSKLPNIFLTLLWLLFLPNSFYLLSDFVHLHATYEISVLYDVAMMASFAFNGLVLGYMSVYLVHIQLSRRLKLIKAHLLIAGVLLLCSFAIYLGRYLRWNSWDVLVDPAGLLFDISDRVINPVAHVRTFSVTGTFFVLLSSMYIVTWNFIQAIRGGSRIE